MPGESNPDPKPKKLSCCEGQGRARLLGEGWCSTTGMTQPLMQPGGHQLQDSAGWHLGQPSMQWSHPSGEDP